MFSDTLEAKTKRLVESLDKGDLILKNFYLAGGTALALQLGHRQSIDLDFFSSIKFSNQSLKKRLSQENKLKLVSEGEGTLHVVLNGVKVSWLYYDYPLIYKKKKFNNIPLASWQDIACMKLSAISSRGSKKDFIDIYFILQKISLVEMFKLFDRKYRKVDYNKIHLLKSLIYFDLADKEPMLKMLAKVSWLDVKKEISKQVRNYLAK